MKYSNDYRVVVEKKYFAVFTDGEGKEQKVEIDKEVADTLVKSQRDESSRERYNRMHEVSLDSMDYEGEIFATYDDYQEEKEELTITEKVEAVFKQMKPKQAELLRQVYFCGKTHGEIATSQGISRQAIQQRVCTAEKSFKKIFEKHFSKTLLLPSFFS